MKTYLNKLGAWIVGVTVVLCLSGCSPNAEKIMQDYSAYPEAAPAVNKAGINVSVGAFGIHVRYSNPLLGTNQEYVEKLSERLFLVDAENPSEKFPVGWGLAVKNSTVNGISKPTTYESFCSPEQLKSKFILLVFQGIDADELNGAETPPLFFILEPKSKQEKLLTLHPLLSGDLFDSDYERVRLAVYSGELTCKIFPLSEKNYTVKLGEIGTDEDGLTFVEFLSDAVNSEDWGNSDVHYKHESLGSINFYAPLMSEITINSRSFRPIRNIATDGVGIREIYDTSTLPDTVFLYANDLNELYYSFGETLVFDGKTKELIRKESPER